MDCEFRKYNDGNYIYYKIVLLSFRSFGIKTQRTCDAISMITRNI